MIFKLAYDAVYTAIILELLQLVDQEYEAGVP